MIIPFPTIEEQITNNRISICKKCGTLVICSNLRQIAKRKYCAECNLLNRREEQREYYKTENYKLKKKRYWQSERYKETSRNYYQRPHVKEKLKIKRNNYRATLNGKIFLTLQRIRRKEKLKMLKHNFTKDEWEKKLKETQGICPGCTLFVGIKKLELDHIIPISKASKNFVYTIEDVQPLCKLCNTKKAAKIINIRGDSKRKEQV